MTDFLGVGWEFPLTVGDDGTIEMSKYEDNIRESIRIILGTAKGERQMRPDFGCGIHELVFGRNFDFPGVGVWDADIRKGWWPQGKPKFPLVLGSDGAGVVAACGARVRRFSEGATSRARCASEVSSRKSWWRS